MASADSQLYVPLKQENLFNVDQLFECTEEMKSRINEVFVHFNDKKAEILLFGPGDAASVHTDVGLFSNYFQSKATNLVEDLIRFSDGLNAEVQLIPPEMTGICFSA